MLGKAAGDVCLNCGGALEELEAGVLLRCTKCGEYVEADEVVPLRESPHRNRQRMRRED